MRSRSGVGGAASNADAEREQAVAGAYAGGGIPCKPREVSQAGAQAAVPKGRGKRCAGEGE